MKTKLTIKTYECKRCNKLIYIRSDEVVNEMCKTCKQPLYFYCERPYNPQNGLRAIKNASNVKTEKGYSKQLPIVECPYCHSTNTKKISGLSKAGNLVLFGVFALGKTSKQFHCNHCGVDF
ncbi:MAG: hypothetical protein HFI75_01480 [Lachnospiraceae bacterium]|nr:hypothetical protein [Lachnospiraceae bacterium]